MPDYAKALLVPGKTIDRAMLLALNPGAAHSADRQRADGPPGSPYGVPGRTQTHRRHLEACNGSPMTRPTSMSTRSSRARATRCSQNGMNVGTRPQTAIPIGMEFDRSDCSSGCVLNKVTLANTFWSMEYRPMKELTRFWQHQSWLRVPPPTETVTIDGRLRDQQPLLPRHAVGAGGHEVGADDDLLRQHSGRPAGGVEQTSTSTIRRRLVGTSLGRTCPACA